MQLYLFNPENDMALAYGGPYYMPPSNARRMAHDLAALPMWYASRGSDVWLAEARQVEWMDRHCPVSLGVRGVTSLSSIYNKVGPWGWRASVAYRLKERGVGVEACPSPLQIERIRELSARGTALDVLHTLGVPHLFGGAVRVEVASDVLPLVKKDGLPEKARELMTDLKFNFNCYYEEKDSIGKRYRRMDAIGTPYCVTVDHQTLEDGMVTLRERDTMEQRRVAIADLRNIIQDNVSITSLLKKLS